MARQKRIYTTEDRAAALAALASNGGNLAKTSRQLEIPRKTLEHWEVQQAATTVVTEKVPEAAKVAKVIGHAKKALAGQFKDFAARVCELTTDDDIKKANLRDRFTAAGIAVDKRQILLGKDANSGAAPPSVIILEVRAPEASSRPRVIEAPAPSSIVIEASCPS